MKKETRFKFNAYMTQLGKIYGVSAQEFSDTKVPIEPSAAQKLETTIQLSAEFLTHINIVPVDEQVGEAIGLGIGSTIAGTTDTTTKDRETSDPIKLTKNSYHCQKTNYDTHLEYSKIDMWAKFADFQTRIRDAIIRRQALDRIMIGFNGTHRADNSDRTKYPLLQDVNSRVPNTRKVNGKMLSADIVLNTTDIGAYSTSQSDDKFQLKNMANKRDRGWWKCSHTGIIFQWGKWHNPYKSNDIGGDNNIPIAKNITETFTISFPNICTIIIPTITNGDTRKNINSPKITVHSFSKTQFIFQVDEFWSAIQDSFIYWFAVGY